MVDVSRRGLIGSIGALAALAVVPATLKPLMGDDVDRFFALARTGIIRGETFLLRRPIVLSVNNLLITKCRFVAACPLEDAMLTLADCKNLHMSDCVFDGRALGPMPPSAIEYFIAA